MSKPNIQQMKPFFSISILLILLVGLFSCHAYKKSQFIPTKYTECRCNKLIRLFQYSKTKNTYYTFDSNGHYKYNSCGIIARGRYIKRNDSIILYCEEKRFVLDSLNKHGFNGWFVKCADSPDVLKTRGKNEIKETYKEDNDCFCIEKNYELSNM